MSCAKIQKDSKINKWYLKSQRESVIMIYAQIHYEVHKSEVVTHLELQISMEMTSPCQELANHCLFSISGFTDLTNPLTNHNWVNISDLTNQFWEYSWPINYHLFNISGCHRFDQSALSLLMGNSYNYKFKMYIDFMVKSHRGDFVRVARNDKSVRELTTCNSSYGTKEESRNQLSAELTAQQKRLNLSNTWNPR